VAPLPEHAPLGIYLHVPFCTHICPYCDFNTYAGQSDLIPRYVEAMLRDLDTQSARIGRRPVTSIFFGGGTPSLLAADQVGRLVARAADLFDLRPDAEITLEANPNGLTREYLADLRAAGVNRLSIGLQTTDRRGLRRLGRMHEAEDAERAVEAAVEAGFDRISLDLIFGWPGQEIESWRTDLETVTRWAGGAVSHLSLYSLIVEPGTPLADAVSRGIVTVPDDDAAADLYELAMDVLDGAGWLHYEVANWARSENQMSVHNGIYWRNGEYLGIGAGAHGRVGHLRTMRHLLPATYIGAIEAGESPESNSEQLSPELQRGETMMLGLRLLREGVTDAEFEQRHGIRLSDAFGPTIDRFQEQGLLDRDDRGVRLTRRGLMLANDVCAAFLD
jgi:putative oxygen-independent coproporphyrinogen III oxidase